MPFTDDDRSVITTLRKTKKYSAKRLLLEFPDKGWKLGGLDKMLRKIDKTGSAERRPGSGRRRSGRTLDNIDQVKRSLLRHDPGQKDEEKVVDESGEGYAVDGDKPRRTSGAGPVGIRSVRQIAKELRMSTATVGNIIRNDLGLRCLKRPPTVVLSHSQRKSRLECAQQLLSTCSASTISFTWFTDRRLFTVATPKYTRHERIYTSAEPRAKKTKKTGNTKPDKADKGLLVCVGISTLGRTGIHFLQPGTKIDGAYYRDVILKQHLLPDIRESCPDGLPYLFQHDGAPVHRARETLQLLNAEAVQVVQTPANSGDLNPVDYQVWIALQEKVYRTPVRDVADLRYRLWRAWHELDQAIIDAGIEQWLVRLTACVAMKGGIFESKLSNKRFALLMDKVGSSPAFMNATAKSVAGTAKPNASSNINFVSPDAADIGRGQCHSLGLSMMPTQSTMCIGDVSSGDPTNRSRERSDCVGMMSSSCSQPNSAQAIRYMKKKTARDSSNTNVDTTPTVSAGKDGRSDCYPDIGPDHPVHPCHLVAGGHMEKFLAPGGPSWLDSLTGIQPATFMETSTGTAATAALSGGSGCCAVQETGYHTQSGGAPSREASLSMVTHHGGQRHPTEPPYQAHHVEQLAYLQSQPGFNSLLPAGTNVWPSRPHNMHKGSSNSHR